MSKDICNNCRVPGFLEERKANDNKFDKNLLSLIIVISQRTPNYKPVEFCEEPHAFNHGLLV